MLLRSYLRHSIIQQARLCRPVITALHKPFFPMFQRPSGSPGQRMSSQPPSPAPKYKLVFFVPLSHVEVCKEAVFAAGAGSYPKGKYSKACFQSVGTGQFLPGDGANPNIGKVGDIEKVEEMRVEVVCLGRETMLKAVDELRNAHPYEEPGYEVYKSENV
ncbi:uncharacterized protein CIMG_01026 [Coccidioides immitis RS]|uniref:ATP phosphoribosyltransferase n=1 Tax=Coccidioides immitis (strain RS) TaxID=246410 RepID=A0A0E1S056_COCIM|nr:uncharacterized protein CIMG_01026 [Coccidioides immitis RS]EAS35672.1 hypothetical protein CIMG_01026 [Coccidioides immitis RS]